MIAVEGLEGGLSHDGKVELRFADDHSCGSIIKSVRMMLAAAGSARSEHVAGILLAFAH